MLAEMTVAFVLVLVASFIIYAVGRYLSPRSSHIENEKATYACGEEPVNQSFRINVSLYKYLVYFVVLDSSVFLAAFASLALSKTNVLLFVFYLLIILVSGALLIGGDQ